MVSFGNFPVTKADILLDIISRHKLLAILMIECWIYLVIEVDLFEN